MAKPVDRRLKPEAPRGFADRDAADIRAVLRMTDTIRRVYESYGFEPVETPFVEYTDALGKFLPDQDRPNEGVFSFQDEDERWLSLRYDLTAPLARYCAENWERLPKPYRSYRAGWVFRNEKPGPGRFRQFMQFDADTVGAAGPAADAEMCMMAADAMEALGIPRGQYVIRVNSRKVLDGVMEAIGLGGEENAGRRLTVLRAIDKLDRLGVEGVRELLGPGRKDESGDFTKGAGLTDEQVRRLELFATSQGQTPLTNVTHLSAEQRAEQGTVHEFRTMPIGDEPTRVSYFVESNSVTAEKFAGLFYWAPMAEHAFRELYDIAGLCKDCGYDDNRVRIDPSVVRGLEYYTGPVFEAELLFPIVNEKGETVRFGSVGGGGRYDGLVGRFKAQGGATDVPATGFSIGVSRLASALKNLGQLGAAEEPGPVVVSVMEKDRIADYQRLVSTLRAAFRDEPTPIPVELYLGEGGMKPQLRYADRRNSPCVLIQGSDERAKGVWQVKDLAEGKRQAQAIASNQEWRAERPGQFEAAEDDLVGIVREIVRRARKPI